MNDREVFEEMLKSAGCSYTIDEKWNAIGVVPSTGGTSMFFLFDEHGNMYSLPEDKHEEWKADHTRTTVEPSLGGQGSEMLWQIRERAGYSQQELADESGVSQHTISEIELGRRKPQGRTLRKLAKVLGVEVADLLANAEQQPWGFHSLSGQEPPLAVEVDEQGKHYVYEKEAEPERWERQKRREEQQHQEFLRENKRRKKLRESKK